MFIVKIIAVSIMLKKLFNRVLFFLNYLYIVWKMLIRRKTEQEPPDYPQKLPLLGHALLVTGSSTALWETSQKVSRECMEKGGALTAYLGFYTYYLITDPEDCLTVSNACLDKEYNVYKMMESFMQNSLLLSDAETWKVHRKLLNPAFNQNLINGFLEIFNVQARRLTEKLDEEVGKSCDVEQYLRLNVLETICMTSIGCEKNMFHSLEKQYLPYLKEIFEIYTTRLQKFWLLSNWIYSKSGLSKKEDYAIAKLSKFADDIIKQRKKDIQTAQKDNFETSGRVKPFMELILEISKETGCFTDDEIRMQTNTIIFAGHDTSASLLTIAFILIGSYPEVQRKVYEEILQVIGDTDRDVDKDDLAKLVYIDAVLKETLRLYPIVPFAARNINKDVQLKNYKLKANSSCLFLIWGMHRHEMWGADAEQFRPERWFEPTIPNAKYFGGFMFGKRTCIGKGYAMMSMKTTVAHVVRKYKISADISKLQLKIAILLKPDSGHHINLELRN